MPRYLTEYGTIVETDSPQKGWRPTDAPPTSASEPESEGSSALDYAKTAAEGAGAGFFDALSSPLRLAGAVNEKITGLPNPYGDVSGRGALTDVARKVSGPEAAGQYAEDQRARAEANPTTAALGQAAGMTAGALLTGGAPAAAGRGAASAMGGGLAARLGGAAVGGALEGAPLGLAQAGDEAWLQRQQIDGEHALAAAGLGALLGGSLSFAAKGAGEVFGAGARKLRSLGTKAEEAVAEVEAPAVAGAAPANDLADAKAFPRQTRYARGARDLAEGAPPDTELPLGGVGRDVEPEELRGALNAEGINSRNRTAKIAKLLDVVPEGAHPDWVMGMTGTQRRAMAEFVGVPEASDITWKALADAVADREGVAIAEPAAAATSEPVSGTFAKAAEQAAEPARKGAYKAWQGALKQMATAVLKKGAGKAVGALVGSTHGPVGAFVGHQVGGWVDAAVERLEASGALEAMVTRAAKASSKAIDGALALGRAAEQPAMRLATGTRQATIPAALAVFHGKHESPEDAYQARAAELADLAGNGGQAIVDRVQESFGPLANDHPGAVMGATDTANRAVQYLLSKLPAGGPDATSFTPVSHTRVPERTEINRFGRIYSSVMKPKTFLADVQRGIATTDQHMAMRSVYPQWYDQNIVAQLGPKLQRRDARGERLSPLERNAVGMMTGVRTGIDSPDLGVKLGPIFDVKGAGDKPSKPVGKSKYADNYSTTTNDILKGTE